tara:strand:- start:1228 stop:2082 length:855 start_codon:yes stop_codon:yes gene_type:complete
MKHSIGIDLGGTKIEAILMNEKGKILEKCRLPTEANKSKNHILNNIIQTINAVKTKKVVGIGIGHPGFSIKNKLTSIHNIPSFKRIDIQKEIQKRTKLKTVAENDANCFALAEHTLGASSCCKNSVGLIIGTGIGAGIIINNKIYHGSHGGAGEVGFIPIGNYTFESLCSGTNMVSRYKHFKGTLKDPNPSDIFRSNDKIAKQVTKEVITGYSVGFSTIINAYDPGSIVIGGGVSKAFNLFIPKVKKLIKVYAPNKNTEKVKILKNKLGDSAGVIGAALLPFQQ